MSVSFWDVFVGVEFTPEERSRIDFLIQLQHQSKIPKTTLIYDLFDIAKNPLTFYAYLGKLNIKESL